MHTLFHRHAARVALIAGLSMALPAQARAPSDLYDDALNRIDKLYLKRSEISAQQLFESAAQRLEAEIEWLMVEIEDDEVRLRVGDGALIGTRSVQGWSDLDDALRDLEALVRGAGHALEPDQDPQLILLYGAAMALDRHSRLLYGERLTAFDKRLKGTFFGIGARLEPGDEGHLRIAEVFEGNPAAEAGLESADVILRIDGQSTLGMSVSDAVARVTGPRGTTVTLEILRTYGVEEELLELTIERDEIKEPNVEWRTLEGDFGYIRIDHFSELTEAYLSRALIGLDEEEALSRGLVIDLRDNTGGSMMQSARAADAFLKSGELVRTVGPTGGKVAGLVEYIWADDDGNEPPIPIVVLQNHRTASGAEILGGALRELDRAVLIGTRSYGKGTVQKPYTMGTGVRLKLTVAEYLLAGGYSIADSGGIDPDIALGEVRFDELGAHIIGDEFYQGLAEPLLFADERLGWREDAEGVPDSRDDPWVDTAIRILAMSTDWTRDEVLASAGEVRELVRAEEEQRVIASFAARGIDWSPAPAGGPAFEADVRVRTEAPARAGGSAKVLAEVYNPGAEDLYRVVVRLSSSDRTWRNLVLPVGTLAPGETKIAEAEVPIPASIPSRETSVAPTIQADGRPDLSTPAQILAVEGASEPTIALDVRLEPAGEHHRAVIDLKNLDTRVLSDVTVRFEYPASSGVELMQYDASLFTIDGGGSRIAHLDLDASAATGTALPLRVVVASARYDEFVDWPLSLPLSGDAVHLEAPTVELGQTLTSALTGPATLEVRAEDDVGLHHLIVWRDRDKLAYVSGSGRKAQVDVPVELHVGKNTFHVEAIDSQGVRTMRTVYIRGLPEAVTEGG